MVLPLAGVPGSPQSLTEINTIIISTKLWHTYLYMLAKVVTNFHFPDIPFDLLHSVQSLYYKYG